MVHCSLFFTFQIFCLVDLILYIWVGKFDSDNKAISVQLNLTGTGTELGKIRMLAKKRGQNIEMADIFAKTKFFEISF